MENKSVFPNFLRLFTFVTCFSLPTLLSGQAATVIVNEASNGTGGVREFIELVVLGPSGGGSCTFDVRGFIFDDNNGDFSCGPASGTGIATGHARFSSTDATWSAVPGGSIIVLYNPGDPNTALPANDPTDGNGDGAIDAEELAAAEEAGVLTAG